MEGGGASAPLSAFDASLQGLSLYPLTAAGIEVLQVNLGRACNQACGHCHLEAGPGRGEMMTDEVMGACLDLIGRERFPVVDITGGAPEMHPGYSGFVERCAGLGARLRTRTNLTILAQPSLRALPEFWAARGVEVVASLPYYLEETVDRQRGKGAFSLSIEALGRLNSAGYAAEGGPELHLVYNPCGAYLPPSQKAIEADFRRELARRHGISFSRLFTITNMPLGRFREFLLSSGNMARYMDRLKARYNPKAAAGVMCKTTLSVGWDGALYDCDFNQALGIKCDHGAPSDLRGFDARALAQRRIVTGAHCFGCTAGAGSSCTGAVA